MHIAKYLKDDKHNCLYFAQKYAWIFCWFAWRVTDDHRSKNLIDWNYCFNKHQKHQLVMKCLLLFREENWKFLPRTYYYHHCFYYYIIIIIIIIINILYHLINYYLFDEVNYYIWFLSFLKLISTGKNNHCSKKEHHGLNHSVLGELQPWCKVKFLLYFMKDCEKI